MKIVRNLILGMLPLLVLASSCSKTEEQGPPLLSSPTALDHNSLKAGDEANFYRAIPTKDGRRLLGFDSQNRLSATGVIDFSSLTVEQEIDLKNGQLTVYSMANVRPDDDVALASGLKVMASCGGWIVWKASTKDFSCFDNLSSRTDKLSFSHLYADSFSAGSDSIAAVRTDANGLKLVLRDQAGTVQTVSELSFETGESLVAVTSSGYLSKSGSEFRMHSIGNEANSALKIDADQVLGVLGECFIHVDEFNIVYKSCPSSVAAYANRQICKLKNDRQGQRWKREGILAIDNTSDLMSILNIDGQILKIEPSRKSCAITNTKTSRPLTRAEIQSGIVKYWDSDLGFTAEYQLDGVINSLLLDIKVLVAWVAPNGNYLISGQDTSGKTILGTMKLDGEKFEYGVYE